VVRPYNEEPKLQSDTIWDEEGVLDGEGYEDIELNVGNVASSSQRSDSTRDYRGGSPMDES